MIKISFKLDISFCKLMVGVIGLSATALYFSTKKKKDGEEPAKNYSSNSSKSCTSAQNVSSEPKRVSINTNSALNSKPNEVKSGLAVKDNSVSSCSKNIKSVNSSIKELYLTNLKGSPQPKELYPNNYELVPKNSDNNFSEYYNEKHVDVKSLKRVNDSENNLVFNKNSANKSSETSDEHFLEIESLQSIVELENNPVFDNNSANKSSVIYDEHLEVESLQNELEYDNSLVKSNIKNNVNKSSEISDEQFLEVNSLQNKVVFVNDPINNSINNYVDKIRDKRHLEVEETNSKVENYPEDGCILDSENFSGKDKSTDVVTQISQEGNSTSGTKNFSASDSSSNKQQVRSASEAVLELSKRLIFIKTFVENEENNVNSIHGLFNNLRKRKIYAEKNRIIIASINKHYSTAIEEENDAAFNPAKDTSGKTKKFTTSLFKIRKEVLTLMKSSLAVNNNNERKKRVNEI